MTAHSVWQPDYGLDNQVKVVWFPTGASDFLSIKDFLLSIRDLLLSARDLLVSTRTSSCPQGTSSSPPQGTSSSPQGTSSCPQGTSSCPQRTSSSPQGTSSCPQRTVSCPQRTTSSPQGTSFWPQGTSSSPQGTSSPQRPEWPLYKTLCRWHLQSGFDQSRPSSSEIKNEWSHAFRECSEATYARRLSRRFCIYVLFSSESRIGLWSLYCDQKFWNWCCSQLLGLSRFFRPWKHVSGYDNAFFSFFHSLTSSTSSL